MNGSALALLAAGALALAGASRRGGLSRVGFVSGMAIVSLQICILEDELKRILREGDEEEVAEAESVLEFGVQKEEENLRDRFSEHFAGRGFPLLLLKSRGRTLICIRPMHLDHVERAVELLRDAEFLQMAERSYIRVGPTTFYPYDFEGPAVQWAMVGPWVAENRPRRMLGGSMVAGTYVPKK